MNTLNAIDTEIARLNNTNGRACLSSHGQGDYWLSVKGNDKFICLLEKRGYWYAVKIVIDGAYTQIATIDNQKSKKAIAIAAFEEISSYLAKQE